MSRLIGAPPGYVGYDEGGQLTEAVRRRPYSVVLFDEIEKAHPDVWNSLLQILDEGRLTDGHGRTVDFRNTVIIMTSNLGTQYLSQGGSLGFRADGNDKSAARKDAQGHRGRATPHLPPRVPQSHRRYRHLPAAEPGRKCCRSSISRCARWRSASARRRSTIELTDRPRAWLSEQGYDPQFGARPLKRAIQHHLENPLSKRLIAGEFKDGETIVVDAAGGELTFARNDVLETVPA